MTILVTGGAGFMGSHMVRWLLRNRRDARVVNLDKLTYAGNLVNLDDIQDDPRYTFVKGDIADARLVGRILQAHGIDVVLNYAAETHVDRSIHDPKSFLTTDVMGCYTLLEGVRRAKVKRMIQISTDEVYGSIEEGEADEESPFYPNSPYAASKAGADHLCRAYWKTFGTPVIVTHSSNCFGPHQYPEKIIPLAITHLLTRKKVPLYGDGRNIREWTFVEDHCRAIATIMEKGTAGEVYNIGSRWRKSNRELVRAIVKELGFTEDRIQKVGDRPGHDLRYALDSDRIRAFGWEPEGTFDARLGETIEWYKTHRSWWKKMKNV